MRAAHLRPAITMLRPEAAPCRRAADARLASQVPSPVAASPSLRPRIRPDGAAAAVAAAVATSCPALGRQRWPRQFRGLRHLRRAQASDADVAREAATSGVTVAVVAGDADSTKEQLQEDQRQDLNVLTFGIIAAILFGIFVCVSRGLVAGAEWFSCYIIEYSLSVDNLFVFIVIFDYFKVTSAAQSKVLNFGIAGAVVLRFLFVYLGAELLERFDFLILFFAAILVYASFKGFFSDGEDDEEDGIENSAVYRTLKNLVDFSPTMDGDKFFTEVNGKSIATPLFLCLLVIEFSDIVFATDSVPAVLGTTQDPFIAYTSNLFAVFGLRSLFFLLRDAMTEFTYLEPAVNIVLGFIGLKIVLDYFQIVEVPILLSLAIVISILALGIGMSLQESLEKSKERGASEEKGSKQSAE
eukprot:TRINITY_DN108294_c0_g1_i1.p1 TRINITY_DN108294_c0_g1~~TRINITY_DN108294_c0_g1_i1.p1  ORF type:complete len:412 (+),score=97.31 TRINITY_DN108294_c0_g1_i1:46-1281(+)